MKSDQIYQQQLIHILYSDGVLTLDYLIVKNMKALLNAMNVLIRLSLLLMGFVLLVLLLVVTNMFILAMDIQISVVSVKPLTVLLLTKESVEQVVLMDVRFIVMIQRLMMLLVSSVKLERSILMVNV